MLEIYQELCWVNIRYSVVAFLIFFMATMNNWEQLLWLFFFNNKIFITMVYSYLA